jgi:hypothetical protein
MMSFGEFAKVLGQAAEKAAIGLAVPTEEVMVFVEHEAKAAIGTYAYSWPKLGPSAIARHGDTPLLDTGALEASIEHTVEAIPGGAEGLVYSPDKVAVYQEMGTSRGIPPRSFLFRSLLRAEPEIGKVFTAFIAKILAP